MKRQKTITVVVALAMLAVAGYLLLYPPPPNLENDGYTSAVFDFREYDETLPALKISTSDPNVVQGLARVIAGGKNDDSCRCINLGIATLNRADGGQFSFLLMPAHGADDCQIDVGGQRYAVDRPQFLSAVAPLGLPSERWTGR